MTDEELVKRLRDKHCCESPNCNCDEAADRIEALVNEAVLSKAAYEGVSSLLLSVQQDCIKERQRAERLEEALLWCSGSADFNEGGVAREGWLKVCAPLLRGDTP